MIVLSMKRRAADNADAPALIAENSPRSPALCSTTPPPPKPETSDPPRLLDGRPCPATLPAARADYLRSWWISRPRCSPAPYSRHHRLPLHRSSSAIRLYLLTATRSAPGRRGIGLKEMLLSILDLSGDSKQQSMHDHRAECAPSVDLQHRITTAESDLTLPTSHVQGVVCSTLAAA